MKKFVLFVLCLNIFQLVIAQNTWQQEVNYKINVSLNDVDHILSAIEKIEYINNSPDELTKIYFHLWPNAYRDSRSALAKQLYESGNKELYYGEQKNRGGIDSLDFYVDGEQVTWNYDSEHPDICCIILKKPLLPSASISITTPFKVKIPSGSISRLGHIEQSYQITQWYPKPAVYDSNGWNFMPYLNQGEFYSEYGSFEVSITLPQNYVVGATGDLQTPSEKNFLDALATKSLANIPLMLQEKQSIEGATKFPASSLEKKTLVYKQDKVHDFAWFADKRFAVLKGEVELPSSKRKVTSWAMFVPHNTLYWQNAIEYINDGTYYYSLWNGDYPYNNVTAIDGTISAGGGMEYPMITVIGNTSSKEELEVVIVHEVGHNWFYGILGSNERVHGWMDEGMNTLNEVRYVQTKYPNNTRLSDMVLNGKFHLNDLDHHDQGDVFYRMVASLALDQPIETHSAEFTSMNYGVIMYQKTGLVFYYLKDYLGDSIFDQAMHLYFEKWKFKHPQPKDLKAVFENFTGKDLSWFFTDLIQTTNHIDYKIASVRHGKTGSVVKVKNVGQVNGPIELNVFKNDLLLESVWLEPGQKEIGIASNLSEITRIAIDDSKDIPEVNRTNNNYYPNRFLFKKCEPLKFEFAFGDNEATKNNIYWLPALGWNVNDGIMLGLAFHNLGLPLKPTQYFIAPMYSFNGKKMTGIAEISHAFFPSNFIKIAKVGLSIKSFSTAPASQLNNGPSGEYFVGINPYVTFNLGKNAPKSIGRAVAFKGILNQYSTYLNPLNKIGAMAEYNYQKNKTDYSYSNLLRLEFVSNTDQNDNMLRVSTASTFESKYLRNSMNRWISVRAYAGYNLFQNSVSWLNQEKYFMSLSGASGIQDNFLENYYFDRFNPTSMQRDENMGGFRSNALLYSKSWMASINTTIQLPIKPNIFVGFVDVGAVPLNVFVNAGLGIKLGNILGVYFPLWRSSNMGANLYDNYAKEIRLTLKFNPVAKPLLFNKLLK